MFSIGQKVVCVDDDFPDEVWNCANTIPQRGRIYTIRSRRLSRSAHIPERRGWACMLCEIVNPILPSGIEVAFMEWRFRPLRPDELTTEETEEEMAEDLLVAAP